MIPKAQDKSYSACKRCERSIQAKYKPTNFLCSSAFKTRGVDDFGFRDRVKWFRFCTAFVLASIVFFVLALALLLLVLWVDFSSKPSLLLLELLLLPLVRVPVKISSPPEESLGSSFIASPCSSKPNIFFISLCVKNLKVRRILSFAGTC